METVYPASRRTGYDIRTIGPMLLGTSVRLAPRRDYLGSLPSAGSVSGRSIRLRLQGTLVLLPGMRSL
jgi:hypothetical protein